jgi:UPF0716 protein FxsA
MWLLLAFLAIPLIEIGLFVVIGGAIGLWATLAWVILAGILGIIVLKGVSMIGPVSLSRGMQELRDPLSPIAHRVMVVVAGGFLLVPGFLTDFVGLLLLIPPVRLMIIKLVARRFHGNSVVVAQSEVIDGEWRDVTVPDQPGSGKSPSDWTRH